MKKLFLPITSLLSLSYSLTVSAQPAGIERGASTLTTLTDSLERYIDPVTTVVYVVAAIVGLMGAIRVYTLWQQGERVMATASGWFGSALFLLIANTVLRSMFIA
jgi:hypothetical protein